MVNEYGCKYVGFIIKRIEDKENLGEDSSPIKI